MITTFGINGVEKISGIVAGLFSVPQSSKPK